MAKIDYDALFGGDDYDPCEALKAIRPQYMKARVNGSIREIKFRDRTVRYDSGSFNELKTLYHELEAACAEKQGLAPKRFAIAAGTRNG